MIIIESNIYVAIGLFGTCGLMLLGLFSTYPAIKAYEKGRNFLKWYIFSVLLFPVALIASFVIKRKRKHLKQSKHKTSKR
ncbi:hypothetical protein [Acetobacterium tundrae]|uniref:Uncharacterized protein n=1 Tax=Acetobacterium tundrae TaxID=132932 RepID=A0ABR6WHK4_9FIRM|nr:hypothetical protein [Acetobacterium tundrae]MBC3795962.1 hypothetical protein [Acetobacterium tundrae]